MALARSPAEIVQDSSKEVLGKHPSWERVELGHIANILNGYAFKSALFSSDPAKGIALIRIRDVGKDKTNTYYSGEFDEQYIVKSGDLLVGMDGDFNAAIWQGENALLNQRVCKIDVNIEVYNKKFLFYVIQPYLDAIHAETSSVTVKHLSSGSIGQIPLPLPPLNVQVGIVNKIEELFSHIDAGVEGLKQTKAKLQQYRQSVLKDAVTGKLTEKWREQNADKLEPADKLLERIVTERRENWEQEQLKAFVKKGGLPKDDKWKEKYRVVDSLTDTELSRLLPLPEGWSYVKLGQLIEDPSYGTSKKCTYDLKGKGVLRIPNIVAGEINSEDMKYAEFTKDEISTYQLKKGDILTIRSNGSVSLVGKCAVVSDKDTDFLFAGYLIRLRPLLSIVDPYYLQFVLMSGFLRKQIEALAKSSSGVNNINSGELQSLIIPMCSLAEQNFISQSIDSKDLIISRQFEQYEKLLIQSSKSKSSILSKAFSGNLVKNNETTKSAEELLERILKEKKLQKVKLNLVKLKPKIRAKKMDKRPIFDVIKEAKKALKVDEIFELAGFNNDVSPEGIEVFYQELKEVSARDEIKVTPFYLDKKKQGDKFEYKEVVE